MSASDIKDCGRDDAHDAHHWYEPPKLHHLAAYGLSGDVDPDGEAVRPVLRYCRGDSGIRAINVRVIIEPEPGTPAPLGGRRYEVRAVLDPRHLMSEVEAGADAHQTPLYMLARGAAEKAAHGYHEAAMKEHAEAEGRPYLDEGQRARARYEAQHVRQAQLPPVGYSPEGDRIRQIVEEANRRQADAEGRAAMRAWRAAGEPPILGQPVYDPSTDSQEAGWTAGYDVRQCAYCMNPIVRIEPAPGYSEWTTNVRNTAGQECQAGPNRLHAPAARQIEPTDTAY